MAVENKRIILCAFRYAALFLLAFWLGTKISVGSGEVLIFEVSAKNTILWCTSDIAVYVLMMVCIRPASSAISMVVTVIRGLALGTAFSFCAVNSVPLIAVAMLLSYGMVSVLMIFCAVLLSKEGISRGEKRIAYLLLTGASALFRVLPVLFV